MTTDKKEVEITKVEPGIWRYEREKGPVFVVRTRVPGTDKVANSTHPNITAARNHLAKLKGDKVTGQMPVDLTASKRKFGEFAAEWMATRQLRERTREGYSDLLKRFILPTFETMSLKSITPATVRKWHTKLLADDDKTKRSHNQTQKAYRLLRTILNTAVADGILARNPCQIRGAGIENPEERPILEVAEVEALAAAMPAHMRALVITAAYAGLRRGELLALRIRHVDLLHKTITVEAQAIRAGAKSRTETAPKTKAGKRTRPLPAFLAAELKHHIATHRPTAGKDDYLFVGVKGGPLSTLVLSLAWKDAREAVGLDNVTLHDLRHFSGTYFAQMGATTREIMGHLGHASSAASMRYQHDAASRGEELAKRMDAAVTAERNAPKAEVSDLTARQTRDTRERPTA